MACMAALATLSTTVGTGIVAGGAVAISFGVANAETITEETTWTFGDSSHAEETNTIKGAVLNINGGSSAGTVYDFGTLTVQDSGTLRLEGWSGDGSLSDSKKLSLATGVRPAIASDITLDNSTLLIADGSYQFDGELKVKGESTIQNNWSKSHLFDHLVSDGDAVLNLSVVSHGWADFVDYAILNDGTFAGTVKINNASDATTYLVLGSSNALGNGTTIVETGDRGDKNIVSLNASVVNLKSLTGNGVVQVCTQSGSAGLSSAALNLSDASGTFSGTIDTGITVNVNGGSLTLGACTVKGALVQGADAAVTLAGSINNTGSVTLTGVVNLASSMGAASDSSVNGFSATQYKLFTDSSTGTFDTSAVTKWTVDGVETTGSFSDGVYTVSGGSVNIYTIAEADSTVTASEVSGETGYLIKGAGATLILDDVSAITDLGNGVEVAVGDGNAATVVLSGVSADSTDIVKTSGSLNVSVLDGSVLNLTQSTGSPNIDSSITIGAGGVVNTTIGDAIGYNDGATDSIVMTGEAGKLATMKVSHRLTQTTNIVMNGYAQVLDVSSAETSDADKAAFDSFGGSISATGTDNVIAIKVRERKPLTIDVTYYGDELKISGKIERGNTDGAGSITKTGAGRLILSNAESYISGLFTVEGGQVQVAENLELRGGITMAAGSRLSVDNGAVLTLKGGQVTLAEAFDMGEGTLAFAGDVTLDVTAFTDFDPTVVGSTLTLGQIGALDLSGASSLSLTTAIGNDLMPYVSLDESGNIVLAIVGRQLSWVMAEDDSSATLVTNNLDVTVNYKDGAYEAVYKNGTATSEPIADGTGMIQLINDSTMLTDSASITLESGTYRGVKFMQVGGGMVAQLGSETDQKKLVLNITGDASVTNFIGGGQGLLGWSNGSANAVLYTDIDVNVNTTGSVAGIVLTGEANAQHTIKVYGDLTANIEAGTIGILLNAGAAYDAATNASLATGAKGMYVEGDVTYNLGKVGNDDSALTFAGNVVGSIAQMNGGATGSMKGDVTINVNSGTYNNIYGVGSKAALDGNVTINYNGGTINGIIAGTAGATVSGVSTLNIGAALGAASINMDTFAAVNVLSGASLNYTGGNTLTLLPTVLNVANGGSVIFADDFVLGKVLEDIVMEAAGALDVTGVTAVSMKLADYECNTVVNEDGTMNYSWELMDSSIFTGVDSLLALDSNLSVKDGKLVYALNNVATDWDFNWGGAALATQPAADAIQEPEAQNIIAGNNGFIQDGLMAVRLKDNGAAGLNLGVEGEYWDKPYGVFGGAYDLGGQAGSVVKADVWIDAQDGKYGAIVGGNMAGNWNGTSASTFTGDVHLMLKDEPGNEDKLYVGIVVGGNFGDGEDSGDRGARFTGDTYVSVYTDSVAGGVIGGSFNIHGATSYFTGITNVFVYSSLTTSGGDYRGESDVLVGGSFSQNGTHHFAGSTNLTIDLNDFEGALNPDGSRSVFAFQKKIAGGFYLTGGTAIQSDGSVNLSINGAAADGSNVTFEDVVAGGVYMSNAARMTVGDVNMKLNGGEYNNVYGGGYMNAAANTTTGDVKMTITGGEYKGLVMGGVYATTGDSTTVSGDINVSVTDAELTGALYGGHHVHGTGTATVTLTAGDITLTVDQTEGGTCTVGDVIGGSFVERGAGDGQTLTQGNIVVNLNGGTIGGDVYAVGVAGTPKSGTASTMTTASTTVNVGSDVTLTSGKTISGGHTGTSGTNWTVTGTRKLGFVDAATYSNLSGVNFVDFDEVDVVTGGVASVATITTGGKGFAKSGTGTFNVTDAALVTDSITMKGGILNAAYGVTSSGLTITSTAPSTLKSGKDLTLAALNIDLTGATSGAAAYVDVTGAVNSTGKVAVSLTGIDTLTGESYVLVNATSSSLVTDDLNVNLNGAEAPAGMEYVVEVVGSQIIFRRSYLSSWVWEGDTDGEGAVWSDDSEGGWMADSGSPAGQDVYFAGTGAGEVTISGDVTPANVEISGGEYTFVADAENGGSIKLGTDGVLRIDTAATVALALDNAELGGTTDLKGTLKLQSGAALGNSELEFNGGTLVYDTLTDDEGNKTPITTDLSKQSSLAADYEGPIKIEVTDAENHVTWGTTDTTPANNSGVNAILTSGIEKTGAGQLTVQWQNPANSTYPGAITVKEGRLDIYSTVGTKGWTFSGAMAVDGYLNLRFGSSVNANDVVLSGAMSGSGTIEIGSTALPGGNGGRVAITANNSAFAGSMVLSGPADKAESAGNAVRVGSGNALGGSAATLVHNGRQVWYNITAETTVFSMQSIVVNDGTVNYFNGSSNKTYNYTGTLTGSGQLIGYDNVAMTQQYSGNISGFTGQITAGTSNIWLLGGEGVANAGGDIQAQINGKAGTAKFMYAEDVRLVTGTADEVMLQQSGAGALILAAENTSTGKLTVDADSVVQLGADDVAGSWAGSELAGEGTMKLVYGALTGLTTKADTAKLVVETTKSAVSTFAIGAGGGTIVELKESDVSLLDSIELAEGSTLLVDDDLTVGGAGNTTLKMAFTTDNFGDALISLTAMIQGGDLTIAGTDGVVLNMNNADVLTALNEADGEDCYLQITDGALTVADGTDINAVIDPNLLGLGVRAQLTEESSAGGYVVINGDVSGVYFTDNQPDSSADTADNVPVVDSVLETYAATVINKDDTLTVSASTTINNVNSQEGGDLVITDGASVVLNNQQLETGVTGYDPMGADNELAGDLTGETGTTISVQGEGGSLTVGGALAADTLTVDSGSLVAEGGAEIADLTVEKDAAMEVGAGKSLALTDGNIAGTLTGEGSELTIGGALEVAGSASGFDVELTDGASIALSGTMDADSLQGGASTEISGDAGELHVGGGNFAGTLKDSGSLTNRGNFTLDNATGSEGWAVSNEGEMLIDVAESGSLTLGSLSLANGSQTTLQLNSDNGIDNVLTLGDLLVEEGADITLASTGAGQLATGQYVLGTAEGYEVPEDLHVTFSGTAFSQWDKLLSSIYVDENGNIIVEGVKAGSNPLLDTATHPNAVAGASLLWGAEAPVGGELEDVYNAVNEMIAAGNAAGANEAMAAVAGSSTASLGMAFAGDVERQLRAIRNRTTTMGVNQCVVNEGMPYFNAWVNAEGNFGELDQDGLASGYQLDSWGGTVGFDVDVNPNLTLGLAVTAMYGDLTVDGPDMLDGDMDTYYVTAFARYSKRAWTHTFIGTIGKMDGSYERTVNYAGGSYKTEGDTDGMAFGLMYEVGRVYALTEDGDACLQPVFNIAYRHTTVGGYTEDSSDAALDVDDQTLDTITLGAGARFQAVVGENLYNRTSVLELRSLAKLDVGDRASEADVAFIGGSRATVESAELGAFGVELGAGLSIPVGDENDGTIFFDVSTELRSGYSNVNGTVGYRINF